MRRRRGPRLLTEPDRAGDNRARPAADLRLVQGGISSGIRGGPCGRAPLPHAQRTNRTCNRVRAVGGDGPNRGQQTIGGGHQDRGVAHREDDRELIAPEPRNQVVAPHRVGNRLAHADDHQISAEVPHGIVHLLEVIDVDQQQTEWVVANLSLVGGAAEGLREAPAVREAREGIDECL